MDLEGFFYSLNNNNTKKKKKSKHQCHKYGDLWEWCSSLFFFKMDLEGFFYSPNDNKTKKKKVNNCAISVVTYVNDVPS